MTENGHCVAIIQARMAASRLPGKVLQEISGRPMLARVVERTRRAGLVDAVVVATTSDSGDDSIAKFCSQAGYDCWRGSMYDVLDRYYRAAQAFSADTIVRITADCPVIDPALVDLMLNTFVDAKVDFAANRLPPPWHRTYPIGLDVEVCTFSALERAWKEADKPNQREHVMPFLYEGISAQVPAKFQPVSFFTSPRGFKVAYLNHDPDYGSSRWTVDVPEDLELIRQVYAHFPGRDDFSWLEILDLFQREPQLAQINASVQHKSFSDLDQRAIRK